MVIAGIKIQQLDGVVYWTSGLAIDADGCPFAYAPADSGLVTLDYLANAGHPGNWYGLATDTGSALGHPLVQGPDDPAPGYYISTTALCDKAFTEKDPRRFVDSLAIPYVSMPPQFKMFGLHVGDVAMVISQTTHLTSPAIIADIGPHDAIGEGSVALARILGINGDAKKGGASHGISYALFPGSSKGWRRAWDDVDSQVRGLFSTWKGAALLVAF